MFYGIIIFNVVFICKWTCRFVDVLFRMYIKSLKEYDIVKCLLNRRHVDSYEEDLNNYVKQIYKKENSFAQRFGRSRSITGLQKDDPALLQLPRNRVKKWIIPAALIEESASPIVEEEKQIEP